MLAMAAVDPAQNAMWCSFSPSIIASYICPMTFSLCTAFSVINEVWKQRKNDKRKQKESRMKEKWNKFINKGKSISFPLKYIRIWYKWNRATT